LQHINVTDSPFPIQAYFPIACKAQASMPIASKPAETQLNCFVQNLMRQILTHLTNNVFAGLDLSSPKLQNTRVFAHH
jgi:hypothetical protein